MGVTILHRIRLPIQRFFKGGGMTNVCEATNGGVPGRGLGKMVLREVAPAFKEKKKRKKEPPDSVQGCSSTWVLVTVTLAQRKVVPPFSVRTCA